MKKWKKWKKK